MNCRHNGYEPFFLPAEILRHMRTKQACTTTPLESNYLSCEVLQLISASPDAYRIERFLLLTVKLNMLATQLILIQEQYCRIFWFPACQNQLTENGFIQASINPVFDRLPENLYIKLLLDRRSSLAVFHPFKA